MSNDNLKVGNKIVEGGRVYRIYKIDEEIIYYKPFYKNQTNTSLVCSIPKKSLESTLIRGLSSIDDIKSVLNQKAADEETVSILDNNEAKLILNMNSFAETVKILRKYWLAKKKTDNFSESKKRVLTTAIERACEEIACVFDITLEKAEKKINLSS